ncbi:MAG: hypothetical protein ACTSRW_07800 [Candidatus Helarchaeota archaeon]
MNENEMNKAIEYLLAKFESDLIAVYGIGSVFNTKFPITSDIDLVVLLSTTENCPRKDWTTSLFEKKTFAGHEFWFLYATLEDYKYKETFQKVSFANWEWAVRSLKYGSRLLWGKDIRNDLPSPPYDLDDIFIRVAYHLEPTPLFKLLKAESQKNPLDEEMRFSKAIFKLGFLLTATYFPEANEFDKHEIFKLLNKAFREKRIGKEMLQFYGMALKYRQGQKFEDFKEKRHQFFQVFIREVIRSRNVSWNELKPLLEYGFGNKGFPVIIQYIEQNGWG